MVAPVTKILFLKVKQKTHKFDFFNFISESSFSRKGSKNTMEKHYVKNQHHSNDAHATQIAD